MRRVASLDHIDASKFEWKSVINRKFEALMRLLQLFFKLFCECTG